MRAILLFCLGAIAALACSSPTEPSPPQAPLIETQVSETSAVLSKAPPATVEADRLLLPDLVTMKPREIYVAVEGGKRILRFSTTVTNAGDGPMEIEGALNRATGGAIATQILTFASGEQEIRSAGAFHVDNQHRHWHLDNFALFELRSLNMAGNEGVTASQSKITFCLIDEFVIEQDEHHAPPPEFLTCEWSRQGISRGWSETYAAGLPGQSLDIANVPDGEYTLRTTIDPDNRLLESNEANNVFVIHIALKGGTVQIINP